MFEKYFIEVHCYLSKNIHARKQFHLMYRSFFVFICITGEYIFWGGGRSTFFARFTLRVYFFCISADDAAAGWLLLMVVLLLTLPCCCCWLPGAGGSSWSSTTIINFKLRHGIKRRMNPFGHDGKHHLFTLRLVWLANVCLLLIQSCKAS